MKIAVVYARYSCDRQNEQSIDGQLRVCNEYAEKNDIVIVDNYIDKAISGTHDKREAFQRMLTDSNKKAWDYVLVYKLDRFSRNKFEMAIHRKHLKDNGIKLLSAMENIPDALEGTLFESMLEGMNQCYSEELSQKTKRGLNETRLKANHHGCKRKDHAVFYLRKKTHCGHCGCKMRAVSAIQIDGKYLRYYQCINDTKQKGKHNRTIQKEWLETIVQKTIMQILSSENTRNVFVNAMIENRKKQSTENSTLEILKNDLQKVNKSIANIMAAIEEGIHTETTQIRLIELETKKKELNEKILISQNTEPINLSSKEIIEFFKSTQEQCPREMYNLLVNNIKVYKDKIEIKLNFTRQSTINNEQHDVSMKLFTEQFPIKRKFSGSYKITGYREYEVYLVI